MLKNKSILFVFFGALFALLGYYREYFFGNYNNAMYLLYNHNTTVPVNENFNYFLGLSYKTAYYLKYVFTLVFFILFFGLSYWSLKVFKANKNLLKWFTYSYLVLLLLSSVLMLWSYFVRVNLDSDEYSVSRWLMGIAQSPLPVLFFLATNKLNKK
ncbi:MAG TPA: hypothetical protein VN026_14140 [Bacteroidia bacterium]|jgi:hypothetical protein|nr:hypothetical protein [Bacteroidia bacterium]